MGGRSLEAFQSKLLSNVVLPGLGWLLLAGGCCSEVVVNTDLTVQELQMIGKILFDRLCHY